MNNLNESQMRSIETMLSCMSEFYRDGGFIMPVETINDLVYNTIVLDRVSKGDFRRGHSPISDVEDTVYCANRLLAFVTSLMEMYVELKNK